MFNKLRAHKYLLKYCLRTALKIDKKHLTMPSDTISIYTYCHTLKAQPAPLLSTVTY